MAGRLEGLRVLVTAAGQGIGRASALAFAREGARVLATDRDEGALAALSREGIETAPLDVLDDAAVARVVEGAGPLDALMHCAGHVHQNTAATCTDGEWRLALDLNLRSAWKATAAALPGMLERGRGSVIYVASAASSVKGAPNRFVYGVTKAGLVGMAKSVAADHVARGVRCNAICPGTVDTPSLGERIAANAAAAGGLEAARAAFVARQPMGRLGRAEEIAALAVWLVSEESAFVTGQALVIDGGWTL